MPALVIGQEQRKQIAELKAIAAADPMDVVRSRALADQDIDAYRDMMNTHSIELPVGYHITYTQEVQPKLPKCHHISISIDRPNKMPAVAAVAMILEEFGLRPMEQSEGVWIEDIDAETKAINIMQVVD